MEIHENAKLTAQIRAAIVRRVLDQGHPPAVVAIAVGVCVRTVRKWVVRFQAEGADELRGRRHCRRWWRPQVVALCLCRWSGACQRSFRIGPPLVDHNDDRSAGGRCRHARLTH